MKGLRLVASGLGIVSRGASLFGLQELVTGATRTGASRPNGVSTGLGLLTAGLLLAMVAVSAFVSGLAYAQEQVTIVWSFWGDPNELPPNYEVIEAFEAAYPHIKIETQHAPWSSYFDRIQTQMAAGTRRT